MPPKKNKWGAHGSAEEDPNAAKWLMALNGEKAESEVVQENNGQEQEPSLLEIKAY